MHFYISCIINNIGSRNMLSSIKNFIGEEKDDDNVGKDDGDEEEKDGAGSDVTRTPKRPRLNKDDEANDKYEKCYGSYWPLFIPIIQRSEFFCLNIYVTGGGKIFFKVADAVINNNKGNDESNEDKLLIMLLMRNKLIRNYTHGNTKGGRFQIVFHISRDPTASGTHAQANTSKH
ncbi:hypothetical protein HELRODRAFT_176757 [Helobdella robusta]|uniref:Uncharacterized protein n=1 Tax=Helobdella robusta TaxID=6412 RepID=T1FAV8_HELRO|nr:hypothetical protein HELRODRAFT_176757 [Helobdella robusta]ESN99592.1 hypothetical protein HELRODRAFT_176757 [Helobdella robusta]